MYYYHRYHIAVVYDAKEQTEITGMLNRPGCGWYQLYAYYLSPDTPLPADKLYLAEQKDGYTFRLALLEFNLAEYKNSALDDSAITNIRRVLQLFSKTKAKAIIRFLYDWDGLALQNEPSDISVIKQHMDQVGQVLNNFSNLIYTTQGIFVGNWAEMHHSNYMSTEDMTTLIACYANATDPSIYLSVRTPKQYRTIVQELEEHPERYEEYHPQKSKLIERIGLFNDGMFGSVSDTGTYQEADAATTEEEKLAARNKELDFQDNLCQNVPNGGEVVSDNPFNDGENAIKDMQKMHISYLNRIYDEAVIRKWQESVYSGADSLYQGQSYYNYITDHMGARYVLKNFNLSYKPSRKQSAECTLELENKGFAPLYHNASFTITMTNIETRKKTIIWNSDTEAEGKQVVSLQGQKNISVPFTLSLSDLDNGEYTFVARLTDKNTGELISFANNSLDTMQNGYVLGTMTIAR